MCKFSAFINTKLRVAGLTVLTLVFILLAGIFAACTVGLGSAVDTQSPSISFADYPPSDAKIRGIFPVGGTWNDDGNIKSIELVIKSLVDQAKGSDQQREYSCKKDDIDVTDKNWKFIINPFDLEAGDETQKDDKIKWGKKSSNTIPDGTYEISVAITDTYGHVTTITRQYTIDNTAPVLVIKRPAYATGGSSVDAYGQELVVSGLIGEATDKKMLGIEIYSEDGNQKLYSTEIRADSEFEYTVARQQKNLAEGQEKDEAGKAYDAIYGTGEGTKKFLCKFYAYDEAVFYVNGTDEPAGENALGNCIQGFCMYQELYDSVFKDNSAYDVYKMQSTGSTVISEEQIATSASLTLNPANNPGFKISGKNPLKLDGTDFSDDSNNISNGTTIVIEVSPGLDGTILDMDSLSVVAAECDANGRAFGTDIVIVPPLTKDANGNITLADEQVQKRKSQMEASGDNMKFKVKLVYSGENGLLIGHRYIIRVDGKDRKDIPVKNLEDTYGFFFAASTAPKLTITNPSEISTYLMSGNSLVISGVSDTEMGTPEFVVTVEETSVGLGTVTSVTTDEKGHTICTFTKEIPASIFAEGGKSQYTVTVEAAYGGMSASAQRAVIYDTEAPQINITYPSEGEWITSAGQITVKGNITDDQGATETVEYRLYRMNDEGVLSPLTEEWQPLTLDGISFPSSFKYESVAEKEGYGSGKIEIRAIDRAGNTSTVERRIDTDFSDPVTGDVKYGIPGQTLSLAGTGTEILKSSSLKLEGSWTDAGNAVTASVAIDGTVYNEQTGLDVNAADGGKTGTWNLTLENLSDGLHTFAVTSEDASGRTSTKTVKIHTDITVPVVPESGSITLLPSKEETQASSYIFAGSASDGSTGTGLASIKLKITGADGTSHETELLQAAENWTCKVEFASDEWKDVFEKIEDGVTVKKEGVKNITITITDKAGNIYTDSANSFIYDTANPELTITEGDTQQYMTANGFDFKGTAVDSYQIGSLVIREEIRNLSGAYVLNGTPHNITIGTDGKWNCHVPLDGQTPQDGSYRYSFVLTDSVGNEVSSRQFATTVDTTAPVIEIVNPADGAKTGVNSVSDDYMLFNGSFVEANLIHGIYWKVFAKNEIYGQNKQTLELNKFKVPSENVLNDDSWTANGWTAANLNNSTWTGNIDIVELSQVQPEYSGIYEGKWVLVVCGTDAAGNVVSMFDGDELKSSLVSYFDADKHAPSLNAEIAHQEISDEEKSCILYGGTYYFNSEVITGTLTASDTQGIADVTIACGNVSKTILPSESSSTGNIQFVKTSDGNWNWSIASSVFTEGTAQNVVITAKDLAGKTTSKTFSVCLDTSAPEIEITAPNENSSESISPVTFSGTIRDDAIGFEPNALEFRAFSKKRDGSENWDELSYSSIGDVEPTVGSLIWSRPVTLTAQGKIKLEVRAKDRLDNGKNASIWTSRIFNYDKDVPVIFEDTLKSYDASITNVSDDDKIAFNTANPYFKDNTIIEITGKAYDTNLLKKITVTDEFVPENSSTTKTVYSTDSQNASLLISIVQNGKTIAGAIDSDSAISWKVNLNTSSMQEGRHNITIAAEDDAGKITTAVQRSLIVDKTAPSLSQNDVSLPEGDQTTSLSVSGGLVESLAGIESIKLRFKVMNDDRTTEADVSANVNPVEIDGGRNIFFSKTISPTGVVSASFTKSGYKKLEVRAVDKAGNDSGWMDAGTFIFDKQNPSLSMTGYNEYADNGTTLSQSHENDSGWFNTGKKFAISGNMSDDWVFAENSSFVVEQKSPDGARTILPAGTGIEFTDADASDGVSKNWIIKNLPRDKSNPSVMMSNEDFADGVYEYKITVTDKAEKFTAMTVTVKIDTTAPVLKVTNPTTNVMVSASAVGNETVQINLTKAQYRDGNDFVLKGNVSDGNGVGSREIQYAFVKGNSDSIPAAPSASSNVWETDVLNDGNWDIRRGLINGTTNSYNNTASGELCEGKWHAYVKAFDSAGNESNIIVFTFWVDRSAPEISNDSIRTGSDAGCLYIGNQYYFNQNLTLDFNVMDSHSLYGNGTTDSVIVETGENSSWTQLSYTGANPDYTLATGSTNANARVLTVNAASFPEGTSKTLRITLKDICERTDTVSFQVTKDTTSPVVTIRSPEAGALIEAAEIKPSYFIEETGSGINAYNGTESGLEYSFDGTNWNYIDFTGTSTSVTHKENISLGSQGHKTLHVKGTDRLGNTGTTASVEFDYDNANPVISGDTVKIYDATLTNPTDSDKQAFDAANPFYKEGKIIEVTGSAYDTNLLKKITVTDEFIPDNGSSSKAVYSTDAANSDLAITLTPNSLAAAKSEETAVNWLVNLNTTQMAEGKHTITITVLDDAGKTTTAGVRTLYVDKTAPALNQESISIPEKTGNVAFSVLAGIVEARSGIDTMKMRFLVLDDDGTTVSTAAVNQNPVELDCGTGTFISKEINPSGTVSASFADSGYKRVQIRAVDKAGNDSGWMNVGTLIYDTQNPVVGMTSYKEFADTANGLSLIGTHNQTSDFSTGKKFSLSGTMSDDWLFADSSIFTVIQKFNGESVTIPVNSDVSVTDAASSTGVLKNWTINKLPRSQTSPAEQQTEPANGEYTYEIKATDKAGKATSCTVKVVFDNTPPVVKLKNPANNDSLETVSFELTKDKRRSGEELAVKGNVSDSGVGAKKIKYAFVSGNVSGTTVPVAPTDASVWEEENCSNGNFEISRGIVSGTSTEYNRTSSGKLCEGKWHVYIKSEDDVGNESSPMNMTFWIDEDAPHLTENGNAGQYINQYSQNYILSGTAYDTFRLNRIEIEDAKDNKVYSTASQTDGLKIQIVNASGVELTETAAQNALINASSESNAANWNLSIANDNAFSEGTHTFEIKAYDETGRVSTAITRSVIVDRTIPALGDVSTPNTAQTELSEFEFTVSASDAGTSIKKVRIQITNEPSGTNVDEYLLNGTTATASTGAASSSNSTGWKDMSGNGNNYKYNAVFGNLSVFNTECVKKVYLMAEDEAGNITIKNGDAAVKFTYDKAKPTVSVTNIRLGENSTDDTNLKPMTSSYITNNGFALRGTASDGFGVKKVSIEQSFKANTQGADFGEYVQVAVLNANELTTNGNNKVWNFTGLPRKTAAGQTDDSLTGEALLEGTYKFKITVTDNSDILDEASVSGTGANTAKTEYKECTVIIDKTPPVVSIKNFADDDNNSENDYLTTNTSIGFENGKFISGTSFRFEGKAEEGLNESGVDKYRYTFLYGSDVPSATDVNAAAWESVSINGNEWNINAVLQSGTVNSYAQDKKLCEGHWHLYVKAVDKAGNESNPVRMSFWVDSSTPSISFLDALKGGNNGCEKPNATYYFNKPLKVRIKDSDTHGFNEAKTEHYSVSIDGQSVTLTSSAFTTGTFDAATDNQTGSYTLITIPVSAFTEGSSQTLIVTSKDLCGRTAEKSLNVYYDNTAPEFTITKPGESDQLDDASLVEETESGVTVKKYQVEMTVIESGSGIKPYSSDNMSVHEGIEYTTVVQPDDLTEWSHAQYTSGNTFRMKLPSGEEGEKHLWVRTRDILGNYKTDTDGNEVIEHRIFYYDKAAPSVDITEVVTNTTAAPAAQAVTVTGNTVYSDVYLNAGKTITVKGTATDTYGIQSITVTDKKSGTRYTGNVTGNTSSSITVTPAQNGKDADWSITFNTNDMDDGSHELSVSTTDKAGRVSDAKTKKIIIDTVAPSVVDDSVSAGEPDFTDYEADGTTVRAVGYKKLTLNVSASVADFGDDGYAGSGISKVQYTLGDGSTESEWKELFTHGNVYSDSVTFTEDGQHTVKVRATDIAGNTTPSTAWKTASFSIDTKAPDISLLAYKIGNGDINVPDTTEPLYSDGEKALTLYGSYKDTGSGASGVAAFEENALKLGSNSISVTGGFEYSTASTYTAANSAAVNTDGSWESYNQAHARDYKLWKAVINPEAGGKLSASGKDRAGNALTGEQLINITLDTQNPKLSNIMLKEKPADSADTVEPETSYSPNVDAAVPVYYVNNKTKKLTFSGNSSDNTGVKTVKIEVNPKSNTGTALSETLERSNTELSTWSWEIAPSQTANDSVWKEGADITITVTDFADRTDQKTMTVYFDTLPPSPKHEVDAANKDLYFRIGAADNSEFIETTSNQWNNDSDADVGSKYQQGTFGNTSSIIIRGAFSDSMYTGQNEASGNGGNSGTEQFTDVVNNGSGVKKIWYKIYKLDTEENKAEANAKLFVHTLTGNTKVEYGLTNEQLETLKNDVIQSGNSFAPLSQNTSKWESRRVFYNVGKTAGSDTLSGTISGNESDYAEADYYKYYKTISTTFDNTLAGFKEGRNYLVLVAEDYAGNTAVDTNTLTVSNDGTTENRVYPCYSLNLDTNPPVITAENTSETKPMNKESECILAVEVADNPKAGTTDAAGVKKVEFSFEINNTTKTVPAEYHTSGPYNGKWTADFRNVFTYKNNLNEDVEVESGNFTITCHATDSAGTGNTSDKVVKTIQIDTAKPSVQIDEIADADKDTVDIKEVNGSISISGNAQDDSNGSRLSSGNDCLVLYYTKNAALGAKYGTGSDDAPDNAPETSRISSADISSTVSAAAAQNSFVKLRNTATGGVWNFDSNKINTENPLGETDGTIADETYIWFMASAKDNAGNIGYSNPVKVRVDRNSDRPVIKMSQIRKPETNNVTNAEGETVQVDVPNGYLLSKTVSGTIKDDDGDIKKLWLWQTAKNNGLAPTAAQKPYAVRNANGAVTGAGLPSLTDTAHQLASGQKGWFEFNIPTSQDTPDIPATTVEDGSWQIESLENDGTNKWYWAVIDKENRIFVTGESSSLDAPYIVFKESSQGKENWNKAITFQYDTESPEINTVEILRIPTNVYRTDDTTQRYKASQIETYMSEQTPPLTWSTENQVVFGNDKALLYVRIKVTEKTGMSETSPVRETNNYLTPFLDVTTASDGICVSTDPENPSVYTYILGPYDMSKAVGTPAQKVTESKTLDFTATDMANKTGRKEKAIVVDNSGTVNLTHITPSPDKEISGEFTFGGQVADSMNTTIVSMDYFIPSYTLYTSWKDATGANETAIATAKEDVLKNIANSSWIPIEDASSTWNIEFEDFAHDVLDYRINEGNAHVSSNYDDFDIGTDGITNGVEQGVYSLPVWFRVKDEVGNVGYVTHARYSGNTDREVRIKFNPNTDRPKVYITDPEISATPAEKGGRIKISGSAEDNEGISAVYLQFDMGEGSFNTNPAGGETIPNSGGQKGIKANNTKNWNYTVDVSSIESSNNDPKYLRVRAIAVDSDDTNKLVSAWSDILTVKINNTVPSFGPMYLRQYAGDGSIKVQLPYQPGMYIKGNWKLEGSVTTASSNHLKSLTIVTGSGTNTRTYEWKRTESTNDDVDSGSWTTGKEMTGATVAYASTITTEGTTDTDPKTINFSIPVSNASGSWNVEITAEDHATHTNNERPSLNIDSTPPRFMDYDGEETDEKIWLYQNSYGSRGIKLDNSSRYLANSNGSKFTLAGKIVETGSGFDKAVFYFKRLGTGENAVARVYNPMEDHGNNNQANRANIASSGETIEAKKAAAVAANSTTPIYINADKLPVRPLTVTRPETDGSECLQNDEIKTNLNIRTGGLVLIGGVYRTITEVNRTTGIVKISPADETLKTEAEFVYGMVVDSNGEREDSDGSVNESDGDGLLESYSGSTSANYSWDATFNSANIPDGPIEIHVVAFDMAGNISHGYMETRASNNAPRITKVMLGTDLNGNGNYDFGSDEFSTFYAANNHSTTSGKEKWTLNTSEGNDTDSDGNPVYWKVKSGIAVIPEFVGGTAPFYYKFSKGATDISVAETITVTETEPLSAHILLDSGNNSAIKANGTSTNATWTYSTNGVGAAAVTNKGGSLTMNNATLGTNGEDQLTYYRFTFWDSTEESTVGTNTGNTILNVYLKQDLQDNISPVTVIKPFHWKDSTDNSLYQNSTANGHIELESDIESCTAITGLTVGSGESAVALGTDPKVSGKITFRGTAYDNSRLSSLWFKFDGFTAGNALNSAEGTTYDAAGTAGEENGALYGYVQAAWYNKANDTWVKAPATMAADGWSIEVEQKSFDQKGHNIEWKLSIDTSKIAGVTGLDKKLQVRVKDASGANGADGSIPTEFSGSTASGTSTVMETYNVPSYQMDVVPYIAKVYTTLAGLKRNNWSVYNRTALGHYPVVSTDNIYMYGFNLFGTVDGTSTGTAVTPIYDGTNILSAPAAGDSSEYAGGEDYASYDIVKFPVSNVSTSGNIALTVNGISTLNNINNDDSRGSYTQTVDLTANPIGSKSIFDNYYNRQPNGDNNNRLTDDIWLDVWEIDSTAVYPMRQKGSIAQAVMKINPVTDQLGFAFANGASYFSMPGKTVEAANDSADNSWTGTDAKNENSWRVKAFNPLRDYSYTYWNGELEPFTSVGFTYDKYGYSYGVASGGDINSGSGDTIDFFSFMTDRWGKALGNTGGGDDYARHKSSKHDQNAIRLETNGLKIGGSSVFETKRIRSPSIVSAAHGSNNTSADTSIYLAYYDVLNEQIRFRAGNIGNKITTNASAFSYTPSTYYKLLKLEKSNTTGLSFYYISEDPVWNLTDGNRVKIYKDGDNEEKELVNNNEYVIYNMSRSSGYKFALLTSNETSTIEEFPLYDAETETKLQEGTYYIQAVPEKSKGYFGNINTTFGKGTGTPSDNKKYVDVIASGTTAGEYLSMGVIPKGSTGGQSSDDVLVIVWYGDDMKLHYAYNTTPSTIRGDGSTEGWTSSTLFTGDLAQAGEYCQLAVDANGGIHIAVLDSSNSDLVYAYIEKYNEPNNVRTCIVDSSGIVGDNLTIDVALKDGKAIPQISYYNSSTKRPKLAYLVDTTQVNPDGAEDELFTGKWECSVVPTSSKIDLSDSGNKINVGVWKDDSGNVKNSTSLSKLQSKDHVNNYYSTSYGIIGGNGTANAVLGYIVKKDSTTNTIETAQMK